MLTDLALMTCDGSCHDRRPDIGDCAACGSADPRRMCDDCRFYAAQDA